MKMHLELIKHYLKPLTMGRGVNEPDPLADLHNFDADIREAGRAAEADGNLEWLRLSIDALIARPQGRIQAFVGERYPMSDEEMVALLRHAHERLWPGGLVSEPGEEADLDFVVMSDAEWEQIRSPDLGF